MVLDRSGVVHDLGEPQVMVRLPSDSVALYNDRDVSNHSPAGWRLILCALIMLLAPSARAEDTPKHAYQGAYWALQAHTGLIMPKSLTEGAQPGVSYGVSARFALFASLLDLQFKVGGGHYSLGEPDGRSTQVDRLSIGIENHAHPFTVLIIQKRPLQQWLAGLYLSTGLDLDLAHRRSDSEWFVYPGFKMGLGSEIPLTDPDVGWSVWLGLNYHIKLTIGDVPELGDMDEHLVEFTIGYRNNDIFFTRAPRLDAFDYKNAPSDDP